ncbi:MAG TPA: hypothetical protein VD931_01305 [Baekduia sp.]|nr:hypothetical protein [Baekduia sp.]
MSKNKKPQRPIMPKGPNQQGVQAAQLALVCQLAQDGLAANLSRGVPLTRLATHAQALHDLQAKLGIGAEQQPQQQAPAGEPAPAPAAEAKAAKG